MSWEKDEIDRGGDGGEDKVDVEGPPPCCTASSESSTDDRSKNTSRAPAQTYECVVDRSFLKARKNRDVV